MPYKDPKKQKAYLKKYRTPYMRDYRAKKKAQTNRNHLVLRTQLAKFKTAAAKERKKQT